MLFLEYSSDIRHVDWQITNYIESMNKLLNIKALRIMIRHQVDLLKLCGNLQDLEWLKVECFSALHETHIIEALECSKNISTLSIVNFKRSFTISSSVYYKLLDLTKNGTKLELICSLKTRFLVDESVLEMNKGSPKIGSSNIQRFRRFDWPL